MPAKDSSAACRKPAHKRESVPREAERSRQLAGGEAGLDADAHVVAGDGVDEGVGEFPQQGGEAGAEGLADEEGAEAAHPIPEPAELRVGEVVEE